MKILIREGSSAKNMGTILNINDANGCGDFEFKDDFLVFDDIHPNDLLEGHVDGLVKKGINYRVLPVHAIAMVTINPAKHYNLNECSIDIGKKANIVLIDNLEDFNILEVYHFGNLVAKNKIPLFGSNDNNIIGNIDFNLSISLNSNLKALNTVNYVTFSDFDIIVNINGDESESENVDTIDVNVIGVIDGEITTKNIMATLNVNNNIIEQDISNDILKIALINRYNTINSNTINSNRNNSNSNNINTNSNGGNNNCNGSNNNININNNGYGDKDGKYNSNGKRNTGNIADGCICGFGLKKEALASSFANDSHNIIVVGCDSDLWQMLLIILLKIKEELVYIVM